MGRRSLELMRRSQALSHRLKMQCLLHVNASFPGSFIYLFIFRRAQLVKRVGVGKTWFSVLAFYWLVQTFLHRIGFVPWHWMHHLLTQVITVYGSMPMPPGRGDVLARHSPVGQHGFIVFGSSPSVSHSQGVRAAPNAVELWEYLC